MSVFEKPHKSICDIRFELIAFSHFLFCFSFFFGADVKWSIWLTGWLSSQLMQQHTRATWNTRCSRTACVFFCSCNFQFNIDECRIEARRKKYASNTPLSIQYLLRKLTLVYNKLLLLLLLLFVSFGIIICDAEQSISGLITIFLKYFTVDGVFVNIFAFNTLKETIIVSSKKS